MQKIQTKIRRFRYRLYRFFRYLNASVKLNKFGYGIPFCGNIFTITRFSAYIWSFSDGKTILYEGHCDENIPASNGLSEKVAAELKRKGFKYLGSVTVYSHLQACGVICDHDRGCPRYTKIVSEYPTICMERDNEKY